MSFALDESTHAAHARLPRKVYYRQPLNRLAAVPAMYAETEAGFRACLKPNLGVGARRGVLCVADEQPERGLQADAEALTLLEREALG